MCSIKLVAESGTDEKLLADPQSEATFLSHYQQALSRHVHKDATFVEVVNAQHYPAHVLVKYYLSGE